MIIKLKAGLIGFRHRIRPMDNIPGLQMSHYVLTKRTILE